MPINIPSDFLANVGVGRGFGAFREHVGLRQGIDPHFPIFTAHHGNRMVDFFLCRGLKMKILNRFFVGVHPFLGGGLTYWL